MKTALKWLIRLILFVGITATLASAIAALYLHFGCKDDCLNQPVAVMVLYAGLFLGVPSLVLFFLAKTFGRHS